MKTKRRHELQTNMLADWLGRKMQAIKPYRQHIIGITLAIVVVTVVIVVVTLQSRGSAATAWGRFTLVAAKTQRQPKDYQSVRNDLSATLWATQLAADEHLRTGSRKMYLERTEAKKLLTLAQKYFQDVIRRAENQPFLTRRAVFGLAQTYECLGSLGDNEKISKSEYVKKAKENYKKLASEAPETMLGKAGAYRFKRLEDPDVIAFYNRFANYSPKQPDTPDDSIMPLPEAPDLSFPGDRFRLPDRPDISFPELAIIENSVPGNGGFKPGNSDDPPTSVDNGTPKDKPTSDQTPSKDDGKSPEGASPETKDGAETSPGKTPPQDGGAK